MHYNVFCGELALEGAVNLFKRENNQLIELFLLVIV